MTENSAFKKRVRARMKETGEKYTQARRALERKDDREREQREEHLGVQNLDDAEPWSEGGAYG